MDWPGLLALALGRVGIRAPDFWTMTPRELMAAFQGAGLIREAPISRSHLHALMRRFPD